MPQQILKANDERETEAARARFVYDLEHVDRSAAFLERPHFRIARGVNRKIPAAPPIDIVGVDGGFDVPFGLRFFGYGGQRKRIISQPVSTCKRSDENRAFRHFRRRARLVFRLRTAYRSRVNKTVIEVQVRAVLPTSGGCAVFLGNNDKVFIIYVDQTVGSAITMFMRDVSKERPLTHDLMGHLMTAVGAHVERIIINDLKNATYYARMIIAAENELQQKKIIELDSRPSDCIAMAVQQKAPIYV